MGAQEYLKCFLLSCLGSLPFLAVVTRQVDANAFDSCEEPCVFIRFFGGRELPSTATRNLRLSMGNALIYHLDTDNTSDPENLNVMERGFPLFVSVQNGQDLRAAAPQLSLESMPAAMLFSVAEWSSVVAMSLDGEGVSRAMPSPRSTAPSSCEEATAREHIHSALEDGYAPFLYVWGIIIWTLLKVLHDLAFLCGVPERYTLWLGFGTWLCQAFACLWAFIFAASCMEVFLAEGTDSACYYRLSLPDRLLAILTPFLLLLATESRLQSLEVSVMHGDRLYGTLPFMVEVHREVEVEEDPEVQVRFGKAIHVTSNMWTTLQYLVIGAFSIGPLSHQLVSIAVRHEWSFSLMALVKLLAFLVVLSSPALGIYVLLAVLQRCWRHGFKLMDHFPGKEVGVCFGLSSIFLTLRILERYRADELQESWSWFFHGITTYVLAVWVSPKFQAPLDMPWQLRRGARDGFGVTAWRGLQMFEEATESQVDLVKQFLKAGGYGRLSTTPESPEPDPECDSGATAGFLPVSPEEESV